MSWTATRSTGGCRPANMPVGTGNGSRPAAPDSALSAANWLVSRQQLLLGSSFVRMRWCRTPTAQGSTSPPTCSPGSRFRCPEVPAGGGGQLSAFSNPGLPDGDNSAEGGLPDEEEVSKTKPGQGQWRRGAGLPAYCCVGEGNKSPAVGPSVKPSPWRTAERWGDGKEWMEGCQRGGRGTRLTPTTPILAE